MMLDVLFKIKDDQDHSLAFRRSCRSVFMVALSCSPSWLLLAMLHTCNLTTMYRLVRMT